MRKHTALTYFGFTTLLLVSIGGPASAQEGMDFTALIKKQEQAVINKKINAQFEEILTFHLKESESTTIAARHVTELAGPLVFHDTNDSAENLAENTSTTLRQ